MDLESRLRTTLEAVSISKLLILGIGNSLQADDGIGPYICDALKPILTEQVINGSTVPENYLQKIFNFVPDFLLIIDAMDFGGQPGEIQLFDADQLGSGLSSTHALNPRVFRELIQKQCNTRIVYLGIQPGDLTMGGPITPAIESSARECIRCITAVLGKDMTGGDPAGENLKN